jgi:hypothetical protein
MKTRKMTTCSLLRRLPAAVALLVISLGAALSASAQSTNYPATILADNPSVYYRFEETSGSTAYDSTTNQWNAAIVENGESTSPVLGLPGIDTNSFLFIGPGPGGESDYGYVSIPEGPLITPLDGTNAGAFSAELWVQPNAYPANWSVPIEQGANNGSTLIDGWNIYVSGPGAGNPDGQSYFYLDMRPGVFTGYGDFLITFGQWYHLVLTFDGASNVVFYINSVPHAQTVTPGAFVPDTTEEADVGSGQHIGWDPFIGGVDEVAFYTNVLTGSQVTNHYVVGLASFRPAYVPAGILTDLSPQTNYSGLPVTFSISASGTPPLTYFWLSNSVPVGPDANALTFTAQYPGNNNANIQVVISNAYGPPVTSSVVTLTVLTNLNVISPPGSITRNVGSHAAFHVTTDGAVPISFQWSVSTDGGNTFTNIPSSANQSATNETLWLSNVQLSQSAYEYSVLVSDPFTNESATPATLTVQARQDPPVPLTGYGAIVAADNPVAYWRLDETNGTLAEDAVGTFDGAYTPGPGTITYSVPTGIPNSTDPAVTLAGGATIQVPWAPELNPDTAWSVETWLNPSSLSLNGNDYRIVLSSEYNDQNAGYPYNGWYLYQQPANDFAFVPQPGNGFITAGPNNPANGNQLIAGNWYHLVVTDDTTNWNIYINGALITSYPVANIPFIPNGDGINPDGNAALNSVDASDDGANFVIGQRDDAQFGTFLGTVDDTAIYQYALSPHQVALHYAGAASLTIAKSGVNVALTWPVGVLQESTNLLGAFTNVIGATSPYTNTLSGSGTVFYRVSVP